jgi:hypothetical protein
MERSVSPMQPRFPLVMTAPSSNPLALIASNLAIWDAEVFVRQAVLYIAAYVENSLICRGAYVDGLAAKSPADGSARTCLQAPG